MEQPQKPACHTCLHHLGGFNDCYCACKKDNPHWKRCREEMTYLHCTEYRPK